MPKRSQTPITTRAAENAAEGVLWDRDIPGFGLRVLRSGRRSWVFKYRAREGAQRWYTIGTFPAQSVDQARREARVLRAIVEQGGDPVAEKREARAAERAATETKASALLEVYRTALPGRPSLRGPGTISERHAQQEAAETKAAIAVMEVGETPVGQITLADVRRLLRATADHPATARLRFGAFSRFLDWCVEEGHLDQNPCGALPKNQRPKPPKSRDRVVPLPAIARLWRAADVLPAPLDDLARVLFALPARRGEVARMDWSTVDLEAGVWTLPGAITKNGDPHELALPPLVLDILRARHDDAGRPGDGLVFPSQFTGGVVGRWSWMKQQLAEAADFHAWTWHDMRRSFASTLAEQGVPEEVADAVLNHRQSATRGGVKGVYQRSSRRAEQRNAVETWCTLLSGALEPSTPGAEPTSEEGGGVSADEPEEGGRGRARAAGKNHAA